MNPALFAQEPPIESPDSLPPDFRLTSRPGSVQIKTPERIHLEEALEKALEKINIENSRSIDFSSDYSNRPGKTTSRYRSIVESSEVLAEATRELERPNEFEKVTIIRIDGYYPYARIETVIRRDPITGTELILNEEAMVADHLIVSVQKGVTVNQLNSFVSSLGASIQRVVIPGEVFLVAFPFVNINTIPDGMKMLNSASDIIKYAEPDAYSSIFALPNDTHFQNGNLWAMNNGNDADIDAVEGWDTVTDASSVTVAVIDC